MGPTQVWLDTTVSVRTKENRTLPERLGTTVVITNAFVKMETPANTNATTGITSTYIHLDYVLALFGMTFKIPLKCKI